MPGNDLSATTALIPVASDTQATARANITTVLNNIINDIEPKVTPAGLDITTDLSFLSGGVYSSATNLGSAHFQDRSADPSTNESVYVKSDELYFLDGNGNAVQLTSGGAAVAGSSGDITGSGYGSGGVEINWDSATEEYRFKKAAGASALADLVCDKIRFDDGGATFATLGAPASMAASLDFLLPGTFPGVLGVLTLDSVGAIDHTRALAVDTITTTSTIAATGAITAASLAATGEVSCSDILHTGRTRNVCVLSGKNSGGSFSLANGAWTASSGGDSVGVPVEFDVDDRPGAITVRQNSAGTSPGQVTVYTTDGDGTVTSHGTSSFASGSAGADRTDIFDFSDFTITAGDSMWILFNPSGADTLFDLQVSYAHV